MTCLGFGDPIINLGKIEKPYMSFQFEESLQWTIEIQMKDSNERLGN